MSTPQETATVSKDEITDEERITSLIDSLKIMETNMEEMKKTTDLMVFDVSQCRTGKLLLAKILKSMDSDDLKDIFLEYSVICGKDGLFKIFHLLEGDKEISIRVYQSPVPEILPGNIELYDEAIENFKEWLKDPKMEITENLYIFRREELKHLYSK